MITPVLKYSARSHVKPRNRFMVLHRTKVKEFHPWAATRLTRHRELPRSG